MGLISFLAFVLLMTMQWSQAQDSPSTKPPLGFYEVTKTFELEQCAQFNEAGVCLKKRFSKFPKGAKIEVTKHFFNSEENRWDLGFVLNGQNRTLPHGHLKKTEIDHCRRSRLAYGFALRKIDKSCKKSTDCKAEYLNYDPCRRPMAISKNVDEIALNTYKNSRKDSWKLCQFVAKPCEKIPPGTINCMKNRCIQIFPNPPKK